MSGCSAFPSPPLPPPPGSHPGPPPSFPTTGLWSLGQALPSESPAPRSATSLCLGCLCTHFTPPNTTAGFVCLNLVEGLGATPPNTVAVRPMLVAGVVALARGPG